ncbi:MAG: DNA topoisomerase [Conexivisphaera sp.]
MILVITEKSRIAQILCASLAHGSCRSRPLHGVQVREFTERGEPIIVVPLEGHITEMDVKDGYSDWRSVDPILLVQDPTAIQKYYKSMKHVSALRELAPRARLVVIATDADEEGCAIGADALKIVLKYNPGIQVKRLWLSTTEPGDVRDAWSRLIEPKYTWANAVEARRRIDAMIGFSATRELTLLAEDAMRSRLRGVLSVGRVQTALLTLLYRREREIQSFVPKPYWSIYADATVNGESLRLSYEGNPLWSQEEAAGIVKGLGGVTRGRVSRMESKERSVPPPPPLNTTRMLRLLSSQLHVAPSRAMAMAEELYLEAAITYPRTDTDRFTTFNHRRVMEILAGERSQLSAFAREVLERNPSVHLTRNGSRNAGDHEPIAPVGLPKSSDEGLRKAWELIARRYLALFYPPAVVSESVMHVDVGGRPFKAEGGSLLNPGFLKVYGSVERFQDNPLPKAAEGDEVIISKIYYRKSLTKPPPRYTEAELVTLMEENGIGTKSSRPEIISILKERKYISVSGGRVYVTELGSKLAGLLEEVWGDFATPTFTKHVEDLMERVKSGTSSWEGALEEVRAKYMELFTKLRENKGRILATDGADEKPRDAS